METATHMLRTGRRGASFQLQMALRDLRNSFARIGLAWSLATHDVASRYRGSVLGPFWITLSMGLMVLGIGVLYANLFSLPLQQFLPYVAFGIVFFGVMTGTISAKPNAGARFVSRQSAPTRLTVFSSGQKKPEAISAPSNSSPWPTMTPDVAGAVAKGR